MDLTHETIKTTELLSRPVFAGCFCLSRFIGKTISASKIQVDTLQIGQIGDLQSAQLLQNAYTEISHPHPFLEGVNLHFRG